MSVFVLRYVYDDANAAMMDKLRPQHRAYLGEGAQRDIVLASGPLTDGSGALILVKAQDKDDALHFMNHDPFYVNGMVAERFCDEWKSVIGAFTDC